jgi:PAS domain S-box-containing protein
VQLLPQDQSKDLAGIVRVLHLEDSRSDQELVKVLLGEAGICCEITTAQTRMEFVNRLQNQGWDLILADYALPSFDGYSALTIAHQLCPNTAFIFVTGVMGEDVAVETLKRGATDYVLKQKMSRLGPAVQRALSESAEKWRRQQAEAELRKSEEQLRLLIDAIKDYALYMVDVSGNVVSWNSGAARILGYSDHEILGRPISGFFGRDDQQNTRIQGLLHAAEQTGRIEEEAWHLRKDGSRFWANLVLSPLANEKGQLRGFAVLTQDVTERRSAVKELEENRQERARMQERFLSHVSHELRTPLTTIVDFTSILLEGLAGETTPDQKQHLELIFRAANQLAVMVNSLLDLTRSDWKRLPVEPACVALEDIISDTCSSLSAKAKAKDIQLVTSISPKLPLVYADPTRAVEILSNLCDNAIKYIPVGSNVEVQCATCECDPDFVQVCVHDNGPGIEPEQARRIFDRFYRMAEASTYHPGGLGLGLYISRELVKAHGGDLSLTSKIGQGSTFKFTLPIFSLARIVLPIMSPVNLATGSVALITLKIPDKPNCSAVDLARYVRSVRAEVKRCTYESSDLVMPAIHVAGLDRRVHVVVFTDDEGVKAIMKRIDQHLSTRVELQPLEGRFELSGRVLGFPTAILEQADEAARSLACQLSILMGLTTGTGGSNESGKEQNTDDRGQQGTPHGTHHQA